MNAKDEELPLIAGDSNKKKVSGHENRWKVVLIILGGCLMALLGGISRRHSSPNRSFIIAIGFIIINNQLSIINYQPIGTTNAFNSYSDKVQSDMSLSGKYRVFWKYPNETNRAAPLE